MGVVAILSSNSIKEQSRVFPKEQVSFNASHSFSCIHSASLYLETCNFYWNRNNTDFNNQWWYISKCNVFVHCTLVACSLFQLCIPYEPRAFWHWPCIVRVSGGCCIFQHWLSLPLVILQQWKQWTHSHDNETKQCRKHSFALKNETGNWKGKFTEECGAIVKWYSDC